MENMNREDIRMTAELDRATMVNKYHILDTPPDGSFDRITKLASTVLNVPIAIVSIVDSDRVWFKSHHGDDASKATSEPGLYASMIMANTPYVIMDATKDPRTKDNPLVRGEFGLKFYAAVPLTTKDGHNLGAFCVLDKVPREFTDRDISILADLAQIVVDELELRLSMKRVLELEAKMLKDETDARIKAEFIASHDSLTGLANRLRFTKELEEEIKECHELTNRECAVFMLDLDKFKSANDTFGHHIGDLLLKEAASRINACVTDIDLPARLGGDEFIILVREASKPKVEKIAQKLVLSLSQPYELEGNILNTSSSVGVAFMGVRDNSRNLVRHADLALYAAKSKGGKNYQIYTPAIPENIQTRQRA